MSAHPEIDVVERRLTALVDEQLGYLRAKPRAFLEELLERAEDTVATGRGTQHCAAQINRDICQVLLKKV